MAKLECGKEFLQMSDTDTVWKTINTNLGEHGIPTLRIRGNDNSVKLTSMHQEKAHAIAAIYFPDRGNEA
jgi:hypothetical protein